MKHVPFLNHDQSKVMLCVPQTSQATLMMRWMNDPETWQYLARFAPIMLEGEQKWLSDMAIKSGVRHAVTDAVFVIVAKNGDQSIIGNIGLHQIDWKNRHAVTGTVIGEKKFLNKGLGTDAKMLLLSWAFLELGLMSVESKVLAFNKRSEAYSQKCGYKLAGRLRKRHFRKGEWHDELLFDVLADEWLHLWKQFELGTFNKKVEETRDPPLVERDRGYLLPG